MFSIFKKPDINEGIKAFRNNKGAVLLDVRTQQEYGQKHIEGSINIPLQTIEAIQFKVENRSVPLYVYCHSGGRSARAVKVLRQMGYSDVTDLGGIINYKNEI